MNKKKAIIFTILCIIFITLTVMGIINNDFSLIEQFGKFLCLDCIGIS